MLDSKPVIAIVDDDASVCKAMERLVRSLGLCASTFTSGDDFLSVVEGAPGLVPRFVILDMQMPGTNGLAVQSRLAALAPDTRVVFITAHDAPGNRERALANGAVAYLGKPFSDDVLAQILENSLGSRTPAPPATIAAPAAATASRPAPSLTPKPAPS